MNPRIVENNDEDSIGNKLCTFNTTQTNYSLQHYFKCITCKLVNNLGVCLICLEICHKGHHTVYSKFGNFFCDCGAKGDRFCKALGKRQHGEGSSCKKQLCTYTSTHKNYSIQHSFNCLTCNLVGNLGVCITCVDICHKGHNVIYKKRGRFFCDCGANGAGFCKALVFDRSPSVILKTTSPDNEDQFNGPERQSTQTQDSMCNKLCTFTSTRKNYKLQDYYRCHTCQLVGNLGVCAICVNICHKGHVVVYVKALNSFCDCGARGDGFCKALVKRKPIRNMELSWSVLDRTSPSLISDDDMMATLLNREDRCYNPSTETKPEDSLCDKLCTFTSTQKKHKMQAFYHCHTCQFVGNLGVCAICAKICHKGHVVRYVRLAICFCDCGARGEVFCKTLVKRKSISSIGLNWSVLNRTSPPFILDDAMTALSLETKDCSYEPSSLIKTSDEKDTGRNLELSVHATNIIPQLAEATIGRQGSEIKMNSNALKQITEMCECSICLDILKEPKLLPCCHRFCRECLHQLIKGHKHIFHCPECREENDVTPSGADAFKTDFHTQNIIGCIELQQIQGKTTKR